MSCTVADARFFFNPRFAARCGELCSLAVKKLQTVENNRETNSTWFAANLGRDCPRLIASDCSGSASKNVAGFTAANQRPRTLRRLCKRYAASTRQGNSSAGESVRALFGCGLTKIGPTILFPVIQHADSFRETLEGRVLACFARPGFRLPEPSEVCVR